MYVYWIGNETWLRLKLVSRREHIDGNLDSFESRGNTVDILMETTVSWIEFKEIYFNIAIDQTAYTA